MDIPRKFAKRRRYIRQSIYALVGLSAIAVITVGVSRLKPAVPSVDRRTIVLDTVERGSMLRKVSGVGTLVSEDILWIPAEVKGRVRRVLVACIAGGLPHILGMRRGLQAVILEVKSIAAGAVLVGVESVVLVIRFNGKGSGRKKGQRQ